MTPVAEIIEQTLISMGINAQHVRTTSSPQIDGHEFTGDVRMSAVTRATQELVYATGVQLNIRSSDQPRIFVVETPRAQRTMVPFSGLPAPRSPLEVYLGLDLAGNYVPCDLAKSPHTGVMGATNSGKSVCLLSMVGQIIAHYGPQDVRLLMSDMKQVELSMFERIAHMLAPVAVTPEQTFNMVSDVTEVMELRYKVMAMYGARSLPELNLKLKADGRLRYPYILGIFDELADTMLADRKRCEPALVRLAQKARAVGIHLLVATQSPRVQVFTGLLKANIPTRIAFAVPSMTDSRVILDQNGAERLLGAGDGLFSMAGATPVRFQGAYVSSDEIDQVCARWR